MRGRSTFLVVLLAAIALVGCEPGGPVARTFDGIFPANPPVDALPIRIIDGTGLVHAVAIAENGAVQVGVGPTPDRPQAINVQWVGGACDDRVDVTLEGAPGDIVVTIRTETSGACRLIGIGRAVVLQFKDAIDPSTMSMKVVP